MLGLFFIKATNTIHRICENYVCINYIHSIESELHCKPIYNKTFLKAKVNSYSDEATDLHSRKLPEEGSNYIFWLTILIGSALKKDENYYPQVFLKESKYIVKEKKAIR